MSHPTQYTGLIDSGARRQHADHEMDHFIDQFLQTRNFVVSAENRQIVRNRVLLFAGDPDRRDQLSAFLDLQFGT